MTQSTAPKGQIEAAEEKNSSNTVIPSEDPGPRPEFKWVEKSKLYVDDRYQRIVAYRGTSQVNKILRDFRWSSFHPIHCGPEDAQGYPIIDGQHQWLAALRHPKVEEVPIWVAPLPTLAHAAESFIDINRNRIMVSDQAVHHAKVAAGHEEALWIEDVLLSAGITMYRSQAGHMPPLSTRAIGTLRKLRPAERHLRMALKIMAQAWPEERNAFLGSNIEAITKLIRIQTQNGLDIDRLRQVLSKMDILYEANRAKFRGLEFQRSSWEMLIDVITDLYNVGLPASKKLPFARYGRGYIGGSPK